MKKELIREIDLTYYHFMKLFSRFQAARDEYFRYYEWYKLYGNHLYERCDKFGRDNTLLKTYNERTYEKFAFEDVKQDMIELAHKGSLQATMLYLFMESPSKWDKKIVSDVEKFEKISDSSTLPEVLGCIAGLHRRDFAVVYGEDGLSDKIKNVHDLCEVIADNWYEYNYAVCIGYNELSFKDTAKAERAGDIALHCFKQLKAYSPEYVEAMRKMQKAYYSRFLNSSKDDRNYFDVAVLLKTKVDFPNEFFATGFVLPKEFAEMSGGKYYSFGRFGTMLNRDRGLKRLQKMVKKNDALKPAAELKQIEFASAALVVGQHNFGATTSLRMSVFERALNYIKKSNTKPKSAEKNF